MMSAREKASAKILKAPLRAVSAKTKVMMSTIDMTPSSDIFDVNSPDGSEDGSPTNGTFSSGAPSLMNANPWARNNSKPSGGSGQGQAGFGRSVMGMMDDDLDTDFPITPQDGPPSKLKSGSALNSDAGDSKEGDLDLDDLDNPTNLEYIVVTSHRQKQLLVAETDEQREVIISLPDLEKATRISRILLATANRHPPTESDVKRVATAVQKLLTAFLDEASEITQELRNALKEPLDMIVGALFEILAFQLEAINGSEDVSDKYKASLEDGSVGTLYQWRGGIISVSTEPNPTHLHPSLTSLTQRIADFALVLQSPVMQRARNAGALLDSAVDWIQRNGIEVPAETDSEGQPKTLGPAMAHGDGSEVEGKGKGKKVKKEKKEKVRKAKKQKQKKPRDEDDEDDEEDEEEEEEEEEEAEEEEEDEEEWELKFADVKYMRSVAEELRRQMVARGGQRIARIYRQTPPQPFLFSFVESLETTPKEAPPKKKGRFAIPEMKSVDSHDNRYIVHPSGEVEHRITYQVATIPNRPVSAGILPAQLDTTLDMFMRKPGQPQEPAVPGTDGFELAALVKFAETGEVEVDAAPAPAKDTNGDVKVEEKPAEVAEPKAAEEKVEAKEAEEKAEETAQAEDKPKEDSAAGDNKEAVEEKGEQEAPKEGQAEESMVNGTTEEKGLDENPWAEPSPSKKEREIRQAVLKVAEEYFRAACQLIIAPPPVREVPSVNFELDMSIGRDSKRGKKKGSQKAQESKAAAAARAQEKAKADKAQDPLAKAVEYLQVAVSLGHARATDYLGCCYVKGLHGLEKNEQKALELITKASELGCPSAWNNLGVIYENGLGVEEDEDLALRYYRDAVHRGNRMAYVNIGRCYESGKGVERDVNWAVDWYWRASLENVNQGWYSLARCYERGLGIPQSINEAVRYFTLAADEGNGLVEAQNDLAAMYELELGVNRDSNKAAEWYRRAAENGLTIAQHNIARCHYFGIGLAKDPEKAATWWRRAAEHGDSLSQFALGCCYFSGSGVDKSEKAARDLWEMAAAAVEEQSDKAIARQSQMWSAEAECNLALFSARGIAGIEKDVQKAVDMWVVAAKKGSPTAMFNLGVCHGLSNKGSPNVLDKVLEWWGAAGQRLNAEAAFYSAYVQLTRAADSSEPIDPTKIFDLYFAAARTGNSFAQTALGSCYWNANGVSRSYEKALEWWNMSALAKVGESEALYLLGSVYFDGIVGLPRDPMKACYMFMDAVEKGNRNAMYALGACLQLGEGHEEDLRKMEATWERASDLGHAFAQSSLGYWFLEDAGLDRDKHRAYQYFELAAENTSDVDPSAAYNAGLLCESGEGLPRGRPSISKALEWFALAADQGCADAQYKLGTIYTDVPHQYEQYVKPDSTLAFEMFQKAAIQGHTGAQYSYGAMLEGGYGVAHGHADTRGAFRWYKLAAEKGNAQAQNALGVCYQHGIGVEKDAYKAVVWFSKAADQLNADACYNLGVCYGYGSNERAGTREFTKAFEWYLKAAMQGHPGAQNNVGYCYQYGKGTEKNMEKAIEAYKMAADGGNANAQYNLGIFCFTGEYTPRNYEKAVRYWAAAGESGHDKAAYNLAFCYEKGYGVAKDLQKAMKGYKVAGSLGHAGAADKLRELMYQLSSN